MLSQLPDDIEAAYVEAHGRAPSKEMLTHLKRDLMQGIWNLMLDEQFMHAYAHGIMIQCTLAGSSHVS